MDLERFRSYLVLLARLKLDRKLRGKLDLDQASDLAMALSYLVFRDGQFEGVAYIREDGDAEYRGLDLEVVP